jgi:hypothetical protein
VRKGGFRLVLMLAAVVLAQLPERKMPDGYLTLDKGFSYVITVNCMSML